MNFDELYDFLANTFNVQTSEIKVYIIVLTDGNQEEIIVNPNAYGYLSIVDYTIARVQVKDDNYFPYAHIYKCIDKSIQAQYEKKLILCNLKKGQQYDEDPIEIIEVHNKYATNYALDKDARMLYKFEKSICEITNDSYIMVTAVNNELIRHTIEFTEVIINGRKQLTYDHNYISPEWFKKIIDEGDLYKNPLNEQFQNIIAYLEDSTIYYGLNLVYKKDLIAMIKLDNHWIKVQPLWLLQSIEQLPQNIQDEFRLANIGV